MNDEWNVLLQFDYRKCPHRAMWKGDMICSDQTTDGNSIVNCEIKNCLWKWG